MTLCEKRRDRLPNAGSEPDRPATVAWEYDECTDRTTSGFASLTRKIVKAGFKRVHLDLSKCKFLSVSGLRHLIEWHDDLETRGITARVTGLSPMLEYVFSLAKLDWILAEKSS